MTRRWEAPCRDRRAPLVAFALLASLLAALPAAAQFLSSDEVPRERTIPEKQQIDDDMQKSKFHLGPVRLLPAISVVDAGYDSNVFSSATDPFADWTATIRLGTKLLLPMGSKMYFLANVFPRYTWYAQLSDRDRWGGTFDGAILGFFNRMSFRLKGGERQEYTLYSSELPSYVFEDVIDGTGNVEVDLTRSLSVFAAGGYQQVRYKQYSGPPLQDAQVKLNNSNDSEARAGLRYKISENWDASAVYEQVWSDFQYESELRDNKSTAYLGAIYYSSPRLFVNATGGYREGVPSNGSSFPEYKTGVGSFFLSFFPVRWIELRGYGHRRVDYSISVVQPYYFDNKVGTGANIEFFERVLLRGYVEDGPNEYPEVQVAEGGSLVQRVDHVKYYGGGLSIKLPASIVLTGLFTRQVYTSNVPTENRSFNRFTAFLNFGGEYSR